MRYKYSSLICMLLLLGVLAGCGGSVGGSASSTGTEDTGILVRTASVSGPGAGPEGAPDVDAAIHMCDEDPEEGLFAVDVDMHIDVTKAAPTSPFDPFPATVEECTITYKRSNEDPGAPIIEQWTQYPNCSLGDGDNTCVIRLIDIERKVRWWNDFAGGKFAPAEYPTHYVAVFKCKYVGVFGKAGYFQTEYDFWIADFDNC